MAVTPTLQTRSQSLRDWGVYATALDLPNAAGNPIGAPEFLKLEEGQTAYVQADGGLRAYCTAAGTSGGGDAIWRLGVPSGTIVWTTVEVALGATARRSGTFTITDATITGTTPVIVLLAPGPYTGKGTLADEAQMYPGITFTAVPAAGTALVYWSAPYGSAARGNVKVNYQVGA